MAFKFNWRLSHSSPFKENQFHFNWGGTGPFPFLLPLYLSISSLHSPPLSGGRVFLLRCWLFIPSLLTLIGYICHRWDTSSSSLLLFQKPDLLPVILSRGCTTDRTSTCIWHTIKGISLLKKRQHASYNYTWWGMMAAHVELDGEYACRITFSQRCNDVTEQVEETRRETLEWKLGRDIKNEGE